MWVATGWLTTITLDLFGNDPAIDRPDEFVSFGLVVFTPVVFGLCG
jgi:hypothetical protein